MTLLLKAGLLGGWNRPQQVIYTQPQSSGAWNGAYGPSWMRGGGIRIGANGGASGGIDSTRAPGAATGWIGAPSWSNSNAKWRQYYAGLENQPTITTTSGGHRGLLGGLLGGLFGHGRHDYAPAASYGYGAPSYSVGVGYGSPSSGVGVGGGYGGGRWGGSLGGSVGTGGVSVGGHVGH